MQLPLFINTITLFVRNNYPDQKLYTATVLLIQEGVMRIVGVPLLWGFDGMPPQEKLYRHTRHIHVSTV